jgi:sugar/nucleoside kinase (ribokinase family)
MLSSKCKQELQIFLEKNQSDCKIVVMPDFFQDRIINLDWTPVEFASEVADVANRKGGSIDGIPQTDQLGGNSINVAVALGTLGASVTPIVCTSLHGRQLIKHHTKGLPFNLYHIKTRGKSSKTTALEFKNQTQKTNVMLRDLGALADFGPNALNQTDLKLIEEADYVCIFNWAGTLKFGTEIAETVFGHVKATGHGKTYYDTADPSPKPTETKGLMQRVIKTDKVDILSVNENEAVTYASLIEANFRQERKGLGFAELAMDAARVLAKNCSARIDLHTTDFSATLKGKREVVMPTFEIDVLRATGAGDAWDAGNILGDWNRLSDECRLTLANANAACYLSDPEGRHPTKKKLAEFLSKSLPQPF